MTCSDGRKRTVCSRVRVRPKRTSEWHPADEGRQFALEQRPVCGLSPAPTLVFGHYDPAALARPWNILSYGGVTSRIAFPGAGTPCGAVHAVPGFAASACATMCGHQ